MELFSVLITGANRGIGLEFVKQLAHSKNPPRYIFATYRNKDTTQELEKIRNSTSSEVEVHLIQLDVQNSSDLDNLKKSVESLVQDRGLTLLINNAGIGQPASFPDLTAENLQLHFKVNTVGPILVAQALLPLLKKSASHSRNEGMSFSTSAILNISSLFGSLTETGIFLERELPRPSYKISKAALNMGMRILAHTVKDDKILVVNICPGWVRTDMGSEKAVLLPQDSVTAILETVSHLDETHHGTFMDRFGKAYSW